jgi:Tol biopolymer transport system component
VTLAWLAMPAETSLADEVAPDSLDSIAFTGGAVPDVLLVDANGGAPVNLTAHPAFDHSPVWSLIGSKIAFVSDRDGADTLHVQGPGGVVAIAPAENLDWAWSPNGEAIAWVNHSGWKDLWVTDVATGISSNLTNGTMEVWSPSWSPDSRRIVFESIGDAGFFDIFVMPRGGGDAINLTGGSPGNDLNPVWSPDGAQIAFVSQRDGTDAIYVMKANGASPRLVVGPSEEICVDLQSLTWSPDGSRLAYAILGCGSPVLRGIQFQVASLATGTSTFLVAGSGYGASGPFWSPDGTKLAVVTGGWNRRAVTVVGADGQEPIALNEHFGAQACTSAPSWSPDGSRLAFAAQSECALVEPGPPPSPSSVYVIDLAGGSPVWVAAGSGPAWRPPVANVGMVDRANGLWQLRGSRFYYGNPGDSPFVGDWDCDGIDTPGLYRQSDGYVYLRNTNTEGNADTRFYFGNPGDIPLAGDFDNDGCDSVSLYRPSQQRFYIINQLGSQDGGLGAADYSFLFGNPADQPVVGDWDGDGVDEVGLHRASSGYFYYRDTLDTGIADGQFYFGNPADRFTAGDWGTVDGRDTPAVFRPSNSTMYFRHTLTQGDADYQFVWTGIGTSPVAGEFGLG